MLRPIRSLVLALLLAPLAAAPVVSAAPSQEATRLMQHRDAERYRVKTEYSSTQAGAAKVHVKAPADVVEDVVTDFGNYAKFIKKFKKSQVLGRHGKRTDVYLQVPILKGAAKIWAIVRFGPPKKVGNEIIVEGHLIQGNVKRLDAKWRIRSIDDQNTQLNLEMLILPKLPVPGSLITDEVAYAADVAVMGSRRRAEKSR